MTRGAYINTINQTLNLRTGEIDAIMPRRGSHNRESTSSISDIAINQYCNFNTLLKGQYIFNQKFLIFNVYFVKLYDPHRASLRSKSVYRATIYLLEIINAVDVRCPRGYS